MNMQRRPRLLRITTVPISLKLLLRGQIPFMMQQGYEVLAISADGPEVADLRQEGIKHQVVAMTRKITPLQDLRSLFALMRVIRTFKPDIIHSHTPKAGLLGMMAGWLCGVPVRLHTVAGLPVMERQGLVRKLLLATEWITYRCATRVYPNSQGLRDFMEKNIRIAPSRYTIIGKGSSNGIDADFFSPTDDLRTMAAALRKQYAIEPGEMVFCFVGRIVGDKGINELVAAFKQVAAQTPCRLLLVGPREDDLDPVSAETRRELDLNPAIISLGDQRDVRPAILAANVFVFPSYREGFPNVVMQACCLERPCIVTDINGCNEIIQQGVTGLIIPVKRVQEIHDAMKWMLSNPAASREFGIRGRVFVRENFNQAHVWQMILEEYTKQLSRV